MMTIQAPWVNLVTAMTSTTTAVATAPRALTPAWACHREPRSLHQCTTMPVWDKVKAVKTPMAYRGIRAWVLPPKSTRSTQESPARMRIPLLKTRRSPRLANCRGRKRSLAMMEASMGNPAKLVLTASRRITAVAA